MNPIEIKIQGHTKRSTLEICAEFLDTNRWSDFKGYSILPGIQSASFEIKTPNLAGSRIKVKNTDGSSHVEEIIEWDVSSGFSLKFQEFDSSLKNLASHFIEIWSFKTLASGTEITRAMTMYPKGVLGWLMLKPISGLMKKAFEHNANQLENK